jgi:hypothetical protein
VRTIGEEVEEILAAVFGNANAAVCAEVRAEGHVVVECTYVIASEEPPFIPEQTSTARLVSELGVFGLFVDPLILQVPEGADVAVATFREDGGTVRPLEVSVVDGFLAAPGREVAAEVGHRFVILELPEDAAGRLPTGDPRLGTQFVFDLELRLPALAPVELKPMFTLAVESEGVTYYPPMLPCVTDFAQVPGFELPVVPEGQLEDLLPQLAVTLDQAADLACDDAVYDFDAAGDPGPAMTVVIDVKPGSGRNPINPDGAGLIPVAVLTTSVADGDPVDFDATALNVASARLGPGGAAHAHGAGHVEDVDGDGDLDLVLHFPVRDTEIECGDTEVTLWGSTVNGVAVEGRDVIDPVPC